VLLELIKPDFLRGSPMIVTVKIFLNAFKRFVDVKTITLAINKLEL
jgi:hypothetical protein